MSNSKYIIQSGDMLSSIAKQYGVGLDELQNANGISNPNLIFAGDTITIPNGGIRDVKPSQVTVVKSPEGAFTYKDFEESKTTQEAGKKKADAEKAWESHGDYTKSDTLLGIEGTRDELNDKVANYGDFNYSNQQSLDDIIQKILNREEFSYDLNGDALYQQYKDKYIQQGKMAMQDTMGQASAMTGGYGSSYASTAGNQAYQASLENLNDIVPELYQMAYDRYNQQGQDMLNQYSLLSDDRATQYGMWGDKYNRLTNERGYYTDLANSEYTKEYGQWSDEENRLASKASYWGDNYNNERVFDYGKYTDNRNLSYTDHRNLIADKQWRESFEEGQRQYNESLAEQKRQHDEQMAFNKQQYEDSKKAGSGSGSGGSGGAGLNALSPSEYNSVMSTIDGYVADGNMSGLKSYLNGLVNRGWITGDEAADLWDQYGKEESSGGTDTSVSPTKYKLSSVYGKKVTR